MFMIFGPRGHVHVHDPINHFLDFGPTKLFQTDTRKIQGTNINKNIYIYIHIVFWRSQNRKFENSGHDVFQQQIANGSLGCLQLCLFCNSELLQFVSLKLWQLTN